LGRIETWRWKYFLFYVEKIISSLSYNVLAISFYKNRFLQYPDFKMSTVMFDKLLSWVLF